MVQKLLISALIAGFGAGLVQVLLQFSFVHPLLLHSEAFETGTLSHFDTLSTPAAFAPEGGLDLVRSGMSIAFGALLYVGWALVLVAGMTAAEDRGHELSVKTGLIWGVAGFVCVNLAPAFGLPPDMPGLATADITPRQVWWYGTVAATAVALWLIAFGQNWTLWGIAIILLGAPHFIGAPTPDSFTGPAPPELAAMFAARTLGVALCAWTALGGLAAYLLTTTPQEQRT